MTTRKSSRAADPWDRPNPKTEHHEAHEHLSPSAKASAKAAARKAGRPYPNLVDNMRAAAKSHGGGRKGR